MSANTNIITLAEALPTEIARVSELAALYDTVPYGFFAARFMRQDIQTAIQAIADGDMIRMLSAHEDLKGYTD